MFKFKFNLLIATTAIPLILLLVVSAIHIPQSALAWDFGPWLGGGFHHWGFNNYGQSEQFGSVKDSETRNTTMNKA